MKCRRREAARAAPPPVPPVTLTHQSFNDNSSQSSDGSEALDWDDADFESFLSIERAQREANLASAGVDIHDFQLTPRTR